MCDMEGLEPKWCCMEINGSEKQPQNRHRFLLISSTELLLASWPLTVAIEVCAVAIDVSVTNKICILSELRYCIQSSLFWRG